MVRVDALQTQQEYRCEVHLNLYKSPTGDGLVTQAACGRHLKFLDLSAHLGALPVILVEDDYPGWLPLSSLEGVAIATQPYQPPVLSADDIQARIPDVIRFTQQALNQPNSYLWGGTVGPNFDCSGLMQAAFASAGIMIPRDSYQQAAFSSPVPIHAIQPGNLLFFSASEKINHVALYLGKGTYVHSSGREKGRDGLGIDSIADLTDAVSQAYYKQLWGAGKIVQSYLPSGRPIC